MKLKSEIVRLLIMIAAIINTSVLNLYSVYAAKSYIPIYGDANADNNLTALDAAIILQKALRSDYVTGIEHEDTNYITYLDVDKDSIISASDAASVLQKVLNNSYKMPCEREDIETSDNHILIAYFSRAGENWEVGYVEK